MPRGGDDINICDCLQTALKVLGIKAAYVSYDDLYLSSNDMSEVARKNPKNDLLQERGVAGTHDINFGQEIINNMVTNNNDLLQSVVGI